MSAARAKKEKPAPGQDDLVRASAGSYRTGDGRFEVEKSDVGWYIVDRAQTNEFGQQLIHGPLATLDAVRVAIPGTRDIKPLLRTRATAAGTTPPRSEAHETAGQTRTKATPATAGTNVAKAGGEIAGMPAGTTVAKAAGDTAGKDAAVARTPTSLPRTAVPPPPSWLDQLPAKEGTSARRLIRALDKEGLPDAENVVKRHRNDPGPTIATRIVEHRLRALVNEQPADQRQRALELVRQATEILVGSGSSVPEPTPRWVLVDLGDGQELPRRRMRPAP